MMVSHYQIASFPSRSAQVPQHGARGYCAAGLDGDLAVTLSVLDTEPKHWQGPGGCWCFGADVLLFITKIPLGSRVLTFVSLENANFSLF